MSAYVVHGMLPPHTPGQTNEGSIECDTIDEVCEQIKQLNAFTEGKWLAISVFHIEDWPKVVDGARQMP